MTRAAGSGPQETGGRRLRSLWWAYSLVAVMVGAVTVAVVWALGTATTPVPRPVADPSVPAIPLPTFVGATPQAAAATARTAPTKSASPTPASPSPTPTPSPDRSATASGRPGSAPSRSGAPGVVELTPLPAEQERDLRSVDGGADTTVEFVNRRTGQVTVYWLNQWGYRVRVERLSPGESHRQDTQVGHPWVVTDGNGRALAVFQPVAAPGRATVR
ncbi:VHL beta domain-containing protein [Micromonospora sagamiensis]|uniref:von Hippel-Lindau disease tumor suppressor protein n=1 Tax=Micromonospora sagamiensis TaxID=47875 RepID=A0A562WNB4_9ACTN|nr:hypothetical protein [Micromonospora sagamiensis]TWJ31685.1 von Hippel-Lindau disease tumor suppressor protein [Micromonospora sagamiensis]